MDKKTRIQSGVGFGIAMGIFFTVQNLLGYDHLTNANIFRAIITGLLSGALSGLLFGWLIGLFVKSKGVTESTKIETEPGETILFQSGANHFKGMEGVGGKLYLTNKRIIFKSHKYNIQNHALSIPVSNIANVTREKTLGIINNVILITCLGKKEKFVVQQAAEWEKHLNNSLQINHTE